MEKTRQTNQENWKTALGRSEKGKKAMTKEGI